jgi:competence ComEA-like helix-hairpin-helix protein
MQHESQHLTGAIVILAVVGWAASCFTWAIHPIRVDGVQPRHIHHRIDLNAASVYELALLPGIGTTIAKRIVAFREQHGPIRSIEQLQQVKGISLNKINLIRPNIVCGTPLPRPGADPVPKPQ